MHRSVGLGTTSTVKVVWNILGVNVKISKNNQKISSNWLQLSWLESKTIHTFRRNRDSVTGKTLSSWSEKGRDLQPHSREMLQIISSEAQPVWQPEGTSEETHPHNTQPARHCCMTHLHAAARNSTETFVVDKAVFHSPTFHEGNGCSADAAALWKCRGAGWNPRLKAVCPSTAARSPLPALQSYKPFSIFCHPQPYQTSRGRAHWAPSACICHGISRHGFLVREKFRARWSRLRL